MLDEFFSWWGRQLLELVPERLRRDAAGGNATVADASEHGIITLTSRRRGIEGDRLGQFRADASGVAAMRAAGGRPAHRRAGASPAFAPGGARTRCGSAAGGRAGPRAGARLRDGAADAVHRQRGVLGLRGAATRQGAGAADVAADHRAPGERARPDRSAYRGRGTPRSA